MRNAAILRDDGRGLRREHDLARRNCVRLSEADLAVVVRPSGENIEAVHAIEQKSRSPDDDARTPLALQRVGVAHRHAVFVDDREVRRASSSGRRGMSFPRASLGVALVMSIAFACSAPYSGVEVRRNGHECGH